jgi:hypothetical protein
MTISDVPYFCQPVLKREGTCSTILGEVPDDGMVAGTGEVAIGVQTLLAAAFYCGQFCRSLMRPNHPRQ